MSLLFYAWTYAQQSWYKNVDVPLDGAKVSKAMADVGNVELDFCDKPWEKTVAYTLQPAENKKLCYVMSNYSDQDLDVHVWFVDGDITNDQWKNKACKQQWEIKDFAQYVTGYQNVVHIPAHGELQYFASLQLPKQFTGVHNWCLVYYLGGVEMWWKVNFTVLMRRAKFIDVTIKPLDIQNNKVASKEHFFWIFVAMIAVGWVLRKKISTKKTRK